MSAMLQWLWKSIVVAFLSLPCAVTATQITVWCWFTTDRSTQTNKSPSCRNLQVAYHCYHFRMNFTSSLPWWLKNISLNLYNCNHLVFFRWYASWADSTHDHAFFTQWFSGCSATWRQVRTLLDNFAWK